MRPETGSAAEAFDALRAEVAAMRTDLRAVAARAVPDYDLTLGEMAKRLGGLESRLTGIERLMPPAMLPGERLLPQELAAITDQAAAAARELRAATGAAIGQQAVRGWIAGTGAAGIVIGILLSLGIAVLLPRQAGAWMATAIVGGDPWTAGQMLMRQGDPAAFERMARLYQACPPDSSTNLCAAAMAVRAQPRSGQAASAGQQ